MTEKLASAGRGEGLVGLVAAIEREMAYHEKNAREHVSSQWIYGNHMMAVGAYKKVLKMLAALEAAAPAGTAQTEYLIKRARVWSEADLRSFPTATLELIDALAAALATPSPQAPAEHTENCNSALFNGPIGECDCQFKEIPPRSEDLQIFVDHARGQVRSKGIADWVDLKNLLRVIDSMKYEAAIAQRPDIATPGEIWRENAAATQEPAGSGASNLSMCGVQMEIMGCFICQGEVKNWCPTHGNGAVAPGSPRKVGEDGQPSKLRPTYYVRHPDDTFSVAEPQPMKLTDEGAALVKKHLRSLSRRGPARQELERWLAKIV